MCDLKCGCKSQVIFELIPISLLKDQVSLALSQITTTNPQTTGSIRFHDFSYIPDELSNGCSHLAMLDNKRFRYARLRGCRLSGNALQMCLVLSSSTHGGQEMVKFR